ncbi:MAG: hypothetical protein NXH91_07740 [Phyllobacteriaceae bacterium]|nr:hypothetical protein [Phyllobacteriaceae bacterium]
MIASETHLSILLAGLAAGETVCDAPPGGETSPLIGVMDALGARIRARPDGAIAITGAGNGCLLQPEAPLSLDLSVSALLVAGLVAPYDMVTRVACPGGFDTEARASLLAAFGAMGIQASAEGNDEIVLSGQATANPAILDARGWSDPVVAAVGLAALGTPGITRIAHLPRDPTVLVATFSRFGARADLAKIDEDWSLAVTGQTDLRAPADAGRQEDDA